MIVRTPRFFFLLTLFIIAYCMPVHPYGFAVGTLVKTPHGYVAIETIRAGDSVVSYNVESGQSTTSKVTRVVGRFGSSPVRVYGKDVSVVADCNQQFYVPITHEWVAPQDSRFLQQVSSCYGGMDQIAFRRPIILCDLVVEPYHTFYVTTHDIIVHNVMEHAIAFAPAITISAASTTLPAFSVIMPVLVPVLIGSALVWMVGKHVISHMRSAEHEDIDAHAEAIQSQPSQGCDPEDPEDSDKCKNKEKKTVADQLTFLMSSKPTNAWFATSKRDAAQLLTSFPASVGANIRRVLDKVSTDYTDYLIKEFPCGTYLIQITKPGNVAGSKAIYYKVISCEGRTITFFKDTFDHMGVFVHRKVN